MRRILRVGMIVASLVGLAGTLAPTPAHAITTGSITIVNGVATVGGHGIAYPFLGSDTGQVDLEKNPVTAPSRNSASVAFAGTGVAAATNVNKPGKLPAEAGLANVVGTGNVHGYCGASHGTLHGTVSVDIPLSGSQHYSFSLSWMSVAGTLAVTGTVHKHGTTQSGLLVGAVNAIPDPTLGGTCLNKHPKTFRVNGEITFEMM